MQPTDEMKGARLDTYTPESIREIAEVLAPQATNYTNAVTEQIGQAQKSIGPLAANAMGSTTAGLGNYTYNRLIRPTVDVLRDEILVEGYKDSLNKMLNDMYNKAKSNYEKSGSSSSSSKSGWDGTTESKSNSSGGNPASNYVHMTDTQATYGPYIIRREPNTSDAEWKRKVLEWANGLSDRRDK